MIVEWEALRIAFISSFIAWYVIKRWRNYNTCKGYEITEFILRRENDKFIPGDYRIRKRNDY